MTDKTQIESPKLGLIVPHSTPEEAACLRLDSAIDKAVVSVKEMRKAVKFLRTRLGHPLHKLALDNIDGLIDEALIPYLDEVDKEFREIAAT